ncbi:hypothetical protein ACFSL6_15565 [Paenibacillus thailandensis]|uniref:Uncharacterized protein n=1 Tax=Paenibacillus thailandensis TaxID=393250 RepID=A0ABW5QVZ9_9BACL
MRKHRTGLIKAETTPPAIVLSTLTNPDVVELMALASANSPCLTISGR